MELNLGREPGLEGWKVSKAGAWQGLKERLSQDRPFPSRPSDETTILCSRRLTTMAASATAGGGGRDGRRRAVRTAFYRLYCSKERPTRLQVLQTLSRKANTEKKKEKDPKKNLATPAKII